MEKHDCIIVLGCGVNFDGTIQEVPKLLVQEAAKLIKQGKSRKILMAGKWSMWLEEIQTPKKTEAESMKEYAISLGVLEEHILTEENSQDTVLNAYFSKKNFLIPNSWKNILIITRDYHVEKAKQTFEKVLGPDYLIKFVGIKTPFKDDEYDKRYQREVKVIEVQKNLFQNIKSGDHEKVVDIFRSKEPKFGNLNSTLYKKDTLGLVEKLNLPKF